MKHKLMQVMMERSQAQPLSGVIEMDEAYWGDERSGGKRGRGAAGETPFVAAVQNTVEGHPVRVKLTVVKGFHKREIASWASQHLQQGSRVVSDDLACFNAVAEAGYYHQSVVTGGGEQQWTIHSFIG